MTTPATDRTISVEHHGAHGIATWTRTGWEIDLVAGTGRLDVPIGSELLRSLTAAVAVAHADDDPPLLHWRVPSPTEEHRAIASRAGFDGSRALVQMRRPLPLDTEVEPLHVRTFAPGDDDEEWLRVNNAAFAWHPEQGGWTAAELHDHLAEPWVDLDGFLLHPASPDDDHPGGAIDGFCWTKIHADRDPLQGEIFVIGVDPAAAGRGLGRQLVISGLHWLALRGCGEALLYTEADNARALGLYRGLGFAVHHEVRVFARGVTGQTPTPTAAPMP